ncbi:MAG: DEAD/DEAH box helicase [Fluviibacter sp.]
MELRPYQQSAVQSTLLALRQRQHPVIQLPTGAGKSLVIAEIARLSRERGVNCWVLTHVGELVAQNAVTYARHTGDVGYGTACAGLGPTTFGRVTFGTVQTVVGTLERLLPSQSPGLIIVDEAHRVPGTSDGMYARVFEAFPAAQRIASTATPWRLDGGLIYGAKDRWFNSLAHRYTVPEAVRDGWLSPLVGVETDVQLELPAPPSTGDYTSAEVEELETNAWLEGVVDSLPDLAGKRKHIAVYCPSVAAAIRTSALITQRTGWSSSILSGGVPKDLREEILADFKGDKLRVLCSVDILTTGFDFPALDCIVGLRPTVSSSLWVQILGRGTRLHEGKKNCLVLDYVGNLQRMGGVDMLETYVRQRAPLEPLEALPAPPREHRRVYPGVRTLAVLDPTSGEQARDGAELQVQVHNVNAVALQTRRGPALMVQYACTTPENARIDATLFLTTDKVNPEAQDFLQRRALAVVLPLEPQRVGWMLKNAARPEYVTVRKAGKYWNVVDEHFSMNI